MGLQTARLKGLNEADAHLLALREKERCLQEDVRQGERGVSEAERQCADIAAQLQQAQAAVGAHDLEVKALEERIYRLKSQRLACQTNKEYQTLSSEIASIGTDIRRMDDQGLALLGAVDQVEARAKEAAARLAAVRAEQAAAQARASAGQDAVRSEISAAETARATHLPGLDAEVLDRYERLLRSRGGTAVAAAIDRVCQGCFTKLSPQVVSLLLSDRDLVTCPSCSRILFVEGAAADAHRQAPSAT
ncbi:MAG: hypothetical protein HY608_03315 [Planctomycetes bacterium]|nr:hypothetical protein [Planctomycetota bacterium]